MILSGFPLIFVFFCSNSDGKSCLSIRKSISTSERHVEHLFAGQNTQHGDYLKTTSLWKYESTKPKKKGRDENVSKMDVDSVDGRRRPVENLSLVDVDQ